MAISLVKATTDNGPTVLATARILDLVVIGQSAAPGTLLLIRGEPGVGKDTLARLIHTTSARRPYGPPVPRGGHGGQEPGPPLAGTSAVSRGWIFLPPRGGNEGKRPPLLHLSFSSDPTAGTVGRQSCALRRWPGSGRTLGRGMSASSKGRFTGSSSVGPTSPLDGLINAVVRRYDTRHGRDSACRLLDSRARGGGRRRDLLAGSGLVRLAGTPGLGHAGPGRLGAGADALDVHVRVRGGVHDRAPRPLRPDDRQDDRGRARRGRGGRRPAGVRRVALALHRVLR